ncbi:MAG: hypothetical protein KF729_27235 [Sandaracinaceae bacterium]|nr:hypothetical protein [Sandaracinaceae bacterium]
MRGLWAAIWVLGLASSAAQAQDVVHRYEPGEARGLYFGGYVISPIYAMPIERGGGARDPLGPGAGAGLHLRIGYELPAGFSVELYGGFGFSEVAAVPMEDPMRARVLTQGELGLGLRYDISTGTPIVPFARLGAGMRLYFSTWGRDGAPLSAVLPAVGAALGVRLALAPFFGIELGALADYTIAVDAFDAGFLSIAPFLGVTLYLFDETDRLTAP